jgi:hypothetical protein
VTLLDVAQTSPYSPAHDGLQQGTHNRAYSFPGPNVLDIDADIAGERRRPTKQDRKH